MPKKTVVKSAVSKKKVSVKGKVSKSVAPKLKKVKTSEEDKYFDENSDVYMRDGKCVVAFLKIPYTATFDDGLGFITILMMEGILTNDVNFKDPYESTFTYDKKHINKIKEIEKKFLKGEYVIDAALMSSLMIMLLRLLPFSEYTPSKVVFK